jgi:uncharacterized cupredoxin-like copper-binding protein
VFGAGTMVFSFVTMMLALAALIVAGQAWSRSNDTRDAVAQIAANGAVGTSETVGLREFSIAASPPEVRAGDVKFVITNHGTLTHEMVIVRAPDVESLPVVITPGGDRSVGALDEEAIAETDLMGEAGDVAPGQKVTKHFKLTPGDYVIFCNIDDAAADGTVTNHFKSGMHATLTIR